MSEKVAKKWLNKAWHNLSVAKLLLEANHFTDVIAGEIYYALEKNFQAYLAYKNYKWNYPYTFKSGESFYKRRLIF